MITRWLSILLCLLTAPAMAGTVGTPPVSGTFGPIDQTWLAALAGGQNQARQIGITAHAGGGQALSLRLAPQTALYQIDTVATTGDSVSLPPCQAPVQFIIRNNGANTLNVYGAPGSSDTINGTAGSTALTIAAASVSLFACVEDGQWSTVTGGAAGTVSGVSNSDGTLTISPTSGAVVASLALGHINIWTGAQTFGQVLGKVTTQAGTTYTFAAADCGTEVVFSSATAVTATIPQTLPAGCNISVLQAGAGTVSVNGSAVAAATLHTHVASSAAVGTAGQWAVIGVNIYSNAGGSSAIAVLTGDGS